MRPLVLFATLIALSIGLGAYAVNWVKLDSVSNDSMAFYIDLSSLRRDKEEALSVVKTTLQSGTVAFERTDNCTSGTAYLSSKRVYDINGKLVEKSAEIITLHPPLVGVDKALQEYICVAAGFPKPQTQVSPVPQVSSYSDTLRSKYPECADQTGRDLELCVADEKEEAAYWERRKEKQQEQIETNRIRSEYAQAQRRAAVGRALQNTSQQIQQQQHYNQMYYQMNRPRSTFCNSSGYGHGITTNCTTY